MFLNNFIIVLENIVNKDWFVILMFLCGIFAVLEIFAVIIIENPNSTKRLCIPIIISALPLTFYFLFNNLWWGYAYMLIIIVLLFILYTVNNRFSIIIRKKPNITNEEVHKIIYKYTAKELKNSTDVMELWNTLHS
jgi:CDP-diglyceride synthetase